MRKKSLKITSNIVNSLQIPGDLAYHDAVITISGSSEVFIENYKYILEYEEHCIIIQTQKNKIKIEGKHLTIQYYTRDEMKIKGKITYICYMD